MKQHNRFMASVVTALAAALSLSVAQPAQAGPGEWDDLGRYHVYYDSTYRTAAVESAGGDFKACIYTAATVPGDSYDLYEADEGHDWDLVAYATGPGCWTFRDIGRWVDGSNHRAEFFIGTEDAEMMSVQYYD
ncbi:hypothetical protein ACWD5R_44665 [Streptomyces sp. NPDC002514]|uniref:hypothetical protein n=1 Tax=Streptomyces sp. NPDC001270 TaxID=3364554 RepID=UPI00367F2B5B